jgi:hypothetical protein
LVVSRMPPDTTARMPIVASSLDVRLTRCTFPPQSGPWGRGQSAPPPSDS